MFSGKKKHTSAYAADVGKIKRARAQWLSFFQRLKWPDLAHRDNVHPIRLNYSAGAALTHSVAQTGRRNASFSAEACVMAAGSSVRLKKPSFWFSIVGVVVLLMVALVYFFPKWLAQFPIQQVEFSGASHYVAQDQIKAAVEPYVGRGFFLADLSLIQKSVSGIPWVDAARVTRKWPATLQVAVVERVPIAVWNREYLISNKGELFKPENMDVVSLALPNISGALSKSWLIMGQYQVISALLRPHGLGIKSFSLSSYLSWEMQLTNGIMLRVDHDHALEKIKQFLRLYPSLKLVSHKIAYVDLRYQKGVAVGWKK